MKEKAMTVKKRGTTITPNQNALYTQVRSTEKKVEKAWADYEEKVAVYENSLKQHSDKFILKGLLAEAKIARLTFKIKKIEHKLAKARWKSVSKADKKPVQQVGKSPAKTKSPKHDHQAPTGISIKAKSSTEASQSKAGNKVNKQVKAVE